jgi:aminoglycoside 6'-N-acetyltransferase
MQQPNITLRPATIEDLALLEYWDTQPHVKASDDDDDEWDWTDSLINVPNWREHLIACVDGRPIGCIQIIDPALEETHYWGEIAPNQRAIDIWIGEATDLNKGYGTVMMELALTHCFADPQVEAIWIDPLVSNTAAQRFYERLDFVFIEKRQFDDSLCKVYRLTRERWQAHCNRMLMKKMLGDLIPPRRK